VNQRFAENDISFSILSDLTDQDLEKIGVASLGHRRQLLREIANLGKTADTPPSAASPAPPIAAPTVTPPAQTVGERRCSAIWWIRLVSRRSSTLKNGVTWLAPISDAASAAVTDMGGKVAKKLGDGLIALFGYPIAQENDAERAERAALSIQRALADLNRKNEGAGKPALASAAATNSKACPSW
jgi:hypothetical protein